MAKIELKNISHSYDPPDVPDEKKTFVVKDLDICWEDGVANALLGPSGCGKTTLLNIISGLLTPTRGQVFVDGEDMTACSPRERGIAQVFQFPVVYDTMNVFDNLAFPLRNEKKNEKDIRKKVLELAEILDLQDHLHTPSSRLCPAEKQKISLGRGIIRENTAAVLLDEPLTVIDPKRKWQLKRKLRNVQEVLHKTMIYVTHDQHEALTFADDVTVIKDGELVQKGSPEELHTDPASPFVGYFIGSPGMNILDFTLKDSEMRFNDFVLPASPELRDQLTPLGTAFQMGIRPEFVQTRSDAGDGWIPLTVSVIENNGAYRIFTLSKGETKIKTRVSEQVTAKEGEPVWLSFPEQRMRVFKDNKKVI